MYRLDGLDEELQQEEEKKHDNVASFEEVKRKRKPFHFWEVNGVDHKMKLTTGMITRLENKYRTNVLSLVSSGDIPPLSIMLTVAQAALAPWEHGMTLEKVSNLYDEWLEDGGNQLDFYKRVIMPTLAVSGFFTENQAEMMLKDLEEADSLM